MPEPKRTAEPEPKRTAQETMKTSRKFAAQAERMGQETKEAAESGFEAVSQSFSEANRGFQAIAAEMTNYSKNSIEDVVRAWEQLLSARTLPEVIDAQTRYAQKAYETYSTSVSELTDLYLDLTRKTTKPVERAVRR